MSRALKAGTKTFLAKISSRLGGCKGDEDKLNTKKIHKNSRDEKSRQISQSREQIYLRRPRHAIQHIDKSSEYS